MDELEPVLDQIQERLDTEFPDKGLTAYWDTTPLLSLTASPRPSIWDTLREVIEKQVKKDGIRKDSIQNYEIESDVIEDAVENIYHDVAEFYAWYFNPDDDRSIFTKSQKPVNVLPGLVAAVSPVVDSNLDAMRDVNEIPTGLDGPNLDEQLDASLSRYITNWQDWYYDRKERDAIEGYFELMATHEAVYLDGEYGDLTNILDGNQYDGVTDVPYSDSLLASIGPDDLDILSLIEGLTEEEILELGLWDSIKRAVSKVVSILPGEQKYEKDKRQKKEVAKQIADERAEIAKDQPNHPRGPGGAEAPHYKTGPNDIIGQGGVPKGNPCHDEKGRFCKTAKSPKGRKFSVVATAGPGENLLDDLGDPCKNIYEIRSKNGANLRLYDRDGVVDEKYAGLMLDSLAMNQEKNPVKPPASITFVNVPDDPGMELAGAYAFVASLEEHDIDHRIFLNGTHVGDYEKASRPLLPEKTGNFMPNAAVVPRGEYIITHEYGHVLDNDKHFDGHAEPLWTNEQVNKDLGVYGQHASAEGYAEAYAEWTTSNGETTNPAAQTYAKYEGWNGSSSLKASGEPGAMSVESLDPDDETWGNESIEQFGAVKKVETLLEQFKLPPETPIIEDYFDGKMAKHIGMNPSPKPTAKELLKAKKVIAEVYGETGTG